MKDITSLGKTITFQYSKSNMTNIVKLALIKSGVFSVSLTTALHRILLSVQIDTNQEISEY